LHIFATEKNLKQYEQKGNNNGSGDRNNAVRTQERKLHIFDGYGKTQECGNPRNRHIALVEHNLFNQLYGSVGTNEQP
jgi:hypothetical protein